MKSKNAAAHYAATSQEVVCPDGKLRVADQVRYDAKTQQYRGRIQVMVKGQRHKTSGVIIGSAFIPDSAFGDKSRCVA